jgi:hypothetical protein
MDFVRRAKNSELAEKLVNLYMDFVGLMETNQQLRAKIQQQESEIANLRKRPEIAAKLKPDPMTGSYYVMEDGKKDGPYCSVCWDVDGMLVRQAYVAMNTICQYCMTARIGARPAASGAGSR